MSRQREKLNQLSERAARFQAIFEEAFIGIAILDEEARVLEHNPALRKILGVDTEDLNHHVIFEVFLPDGASTDLSQYRELWRDKRRYYKAERYFLRRGVEPTWVELTISGLEEGPNRQKMAVLMVEDITDQKQAQEALVQTEKLAITGRLAASLAHEINNPLQSVIGYLGLAMELLEEGEKVDEHLQIALEELRRASDIVARLRDLNRQSRPEERTPTDVNDLMEQVVTLIQGKASHRGIEIVWEPERELPTLMLVSDRIHQVFLNLLLNAVDAMPEGGQLEVSTYYADWSGEVCVSISDSGEGIPSDILPRLFSPFYSTKPSGLGLGLYISQNIVEEHGGRIEVESWENEGTTFEVWLPTG